MEQRNRARTERARNKALALAAIKSIHTLAWFSIESCVMYLVYSGFRRKSDRTAAVVRGETLIFAATGFRCPLTRQP